MGKKTELKLRVKKLKAENKHMRKAAKISVKAIEEKDTKIAQLTSVIEIQNTPKQVRA